MRRRKEPRSLDTIAEDDREQLADHQGLAAAWSRRERAGRLMRELGKSAGASRTPTASRPAPAAGRVATS